MTWIRKGTVMNPGDRIYYLDWDGYECSQVVVARTRIEKNPRQIIECQYYPVPVDAIDGYSRYSGRVKVVRGGLPGTSRR